MSPLSGESPLHRFRAAWLRVLLFETRLHVREDVYRTSTVARLAF
jgi:hypothetical protein